MWQKRQRSSSESATLTNALKSATTYYWFVTTKDGHGGETSSEIISFTTKNTPPTAAVLTAPADAATNVLVGHSLSWDAGTDADGDDLTYDVYLDKTNPPTTKVASDVTTLSELISLFNAPDGSTTYYWFVTTKDGKGGEILSMNVMFNGATLFNSDISRWTPVNVEFMIQMFYDATNFKQNLDSWNIPNEVNQKNMFKGSGLEDNPPIWYHP